MKSDASSVPNDGSQPLSPSSASAKKENVSLNKYHVESEAPVVQLQPLVSLPSKTVVIDAISSGNLVHENHVSDGNAGWSVANIKEASPHIEIADTVNSQLTVSDGTYQFCQDKGAFLLLVYYTHVIV